MRTQPALIANHTLAITPASSISDILRAGCLAVSPAARSISHSGNPARTRARLSPSASSQPTILRVHLSDSAEHDWNSGAASSWALVLRQTIRNPPAETVHTRPAVSDSADHDQQSAATFLRQRRIRHRRHEPRPDEHAGGIQPLQPELDQHLDPATAAAEPRAAKGTVERLGTEHGG